MDVRVTRRAAEKAARNLINDRAGLVGEVGVADAERTRLATDLGAAVIRGRDLVAAADQEAARLLTEAQTDLSDSETRYATARTTATDGGWLTADLTALGYPPAKIKRAQAHHGPAGRKDVVHAVADTGRKDRDGNAAPSGAD